MKCAICGYDDHGTGDSAHSCGTSFFMKSELPADAGADNLPPLPEPRAIRAGHGFPKVYALAYTAEQMREYALAALRAQQPAPQAEPMPTVIKVGEYSTLRYEARTTGEPGWLLYGAHDNLIRAMTLVEVDLIEAALASRGASQGRITKQNSVSNSSSNCTSEGAAQALDMGNSQQSIDFDARFREALTKYVISTSTGIGEVKAGLELTDSIHAWAARRAVPEVVQQALDIALDLAMAEADNVHKTYAGYKQHKHDAADRDVETIKRAIDAINPAAASVTGNAK